MFSSHENVETLAQLFAKAKEYAKMQGEYIKLDVAEKGVRLLKAVALCLVVILLALPILLFLSIALAHAIAPWTGLVGAYAIIALCYIAGLLIVFANRKRWIERPLVRFLTSMLLGE
ncbi:MAG: phage holin family protein [Bacteroidaceae bacterium]|nr:phage holin family protein [Bacteroidaceae bacterium]